MKKKSILLSCLSLFLLGLLLSGCSQRLATMTAISTRNVSLNNVDLDKLPQKKNITGTDSRFVFLFIPFGVPTLQGAVDEALAQGNGDLIIDGVVKAEGWWFIIGQNSISITGNVINTKGGI